MKRQKIVRRSKRRKLRPYQQDMLQYSRERRHPALFAEMRLGKTIVVVRRVQEYPDIKRVLVVAPYSALASWKKELTLENEAFISLLGTRDERLRILSAPSKWYLINKEGFLILEELAEIKWDVVILDESSFLRNPQTKVSRFFTEHFENVQYKWVLTGTPDPESYLDFFQQMLFLDRRILGYHNIWIFRKTCFVQIDHNYYLKTKGKQFLVERLASNCFFLKRKDVNLHVRKIYTTRNIALNDKAERVYRKLEKDFVLEYGDVEKRTLFKVAQYTWLRRICGGFVEDQLIFLGKLLEIQNLLETELHGHQVIIWAVFTNEIKLLERELSKKYTCRIIHGDTKFSAREQAQRDFHNGDVQNLIVQPECAKHGTDFSAASAAIYYSSPLGFETRSQSEDRIIMPNQPDAAFIIDLIVEHSIEESIQRSLISKEGRRLMFQRILREMKERCSMK